MGGVSVPGQIIGSIEHARIQTNQLIIRFIHDPASKNINCNATPVYDGALFCAPCFFSVNKIINFPS